MGRRKKAISAEQILAAKMAKDFEAVAAKRLLDPTAKRFFVAFMLAIPTLEGVYMNTIVSVLDRHLGNQKIDEVMERL